MLFRQALRNIFVAVLGLFFALSTAQDASCTTSMQASSTPAAGTGVLLEKFSYCDGVLDATAFVENVDYDKIVTLYYTDGSNSSTPLSLTTMTYDSDVDGTWQYWSCSTPVYVDGITELLNLTYQATDNNVVYSQQLGIAVVASGASIPSPPPPPTPYATPSGLSDDITTWLAIANSSDVATCKARMFENINSPGAINGTVVASTSTANPDYHYNWVRDAALTMDVVCDLYIAASEPTALSFYEEILFQYAQARADEHQIGGLGEPKFFLNNTLFTGPWGRPQNDGPAESAATLINFANAYLANNGSIETVRKQIYDSNTYPTLAPVQRDLLYVAANWSLESFDLWEEESSYHFFNALVSHRALVLGSEFASKLNDSKTSATLSTAAKAVVASLSKFWDPNRLLLLYEYGPVLKNKTSFKDIAVILGVLHGYAGDGVYSYTNDQVLTSSYQIATSFLSVYPIAKVTIDSSGGILGIPIGRYPEDVYTGTGTAPDGGNPWFLATATMAELFYKAIPEFETAGQISVTNTSLPFWNYFAPSAALTTESKYSSDTPSYKVAISALEGWADAFMRRVKFHKPADGRFAEEYDRTTGDITGAKDLTWSYASILTASMARAKLMNDTSYITDLANLGFVL